MTISSTYTRGNTVYYYGKDITRVFYPIENDEPISLPTQTPTIYIFSSAPSRTDAAAGTGAVQTISAWSEQVETPYARTYTISAIDDPSPTSSEGDNTYYEALNFILATSQQTQTLIRSFELTRARGHYDEPGTRPYDLITVFKAAEDYWTYEQMQDHISMALEIFKIDLLAKGWRWADVGELRFAKWAVAYKALSSLSSGQRREEGDRFDVHAKEWAANYERLINSIKLRADLDGDGEPEIEVEPTNNYVISAR